jgi:hypothetical protein
MPARRIYFYFFISGTQAGIGVKLLFCERFVVHPSLAGVAFDLYNSFRLAMKPLGRLPFFFLHQPITGNFPPSSVSCERLGPIINDEQKAAYVEMVEAASHSPEAFKTNATLSNCLPTSAGCTSTLIGCHDFTIRMHMAV